MSARGGFDRFLRWVAPRFTPADCGYSKVVGEAHRFLRYRLWRWSADHRYWKERALIAEATVKRLQSGGQ